MKKPTISIFFPCFNDEPSIGKLVRTANSIASKLSRGYEIIVVNDGSTDRSLGVLQQLQKKLTKLKVVNHKKNRGYGGALKSGFKKASKQLVFYTDGDGQYDLSELDLLLDCMTSDIDVVNGIKMQRSDENLRIFLGNAYKSFVRNLFNLPIYDVDCDFRLIRQKYIRKINLRSNSGAVCLELVKELHLSGARFREVSVHHYPRRFGRSEFFRPGSLFKTAWEILKLWGKFHVSVFFLRLF